MFNNNEFAFDKALHLAELSALAYKDASTIKKIAKNYGYKNVEFFDNDGAQAYGVVKDDVAIIAFRGTEPTCFNDIKADLNAIHCVGRYGYLIHRGFHTEVEDIWPLIEKWLDKQKYTQVYTTGHSLGGAMATVAATHLPVGTIVYSYGAPRVGSPVFAKEFNKRYSCYRFVNNNDIVPRVPFAILWYKHVGKLFYINTWGNIRNASAWQRIKDRFRGYRQAWRKGEIFDSIYDHDINRYINKIKNAVGEKAPK
jgi:triacylglycerol lipase